MIDHILPLFLYAFLTIAVSAGLLLLAMLIERVRFLRRQRREWERLMAAQKRREACGRMRTRAMMPRTPWRERGRW